MAKKIIDLGTAELTGDGESLRSAFSKTNDNFTELYDSVAVNVSNIATNTSNILNHENRLDSLEDGNITTDIVGSVFADGSTLLVDGVSGKIVGDIQTTSLRTSETKIALGLDAGGIGQAPGTIAIGAYAASTNQAVGSIAIGQNAGGDGQGATAVAIGYGAGNIAQGSNSVAVGMSAGTDTQGSGSTAIGFGAGAISQGEYALALGFNAGQNNQADRSIVINATDSVLENTTEDSFIVKPIRESVGTSILMYDVTTGEVTHNPILDGDITGSVFADDSTLLVDGVDGTIPAENLVGTAQIDIKGNLFAEDSMLLVDGINSKIVGPVEAPTITSSSYVDASSINANTYGAKTVGSFINFGVNASVINMASAIDMQTYSIGNVGTISSSDGNDLILDSSTGGQILIGQNSGIDDIVIGNNDNGTQVVLQGDTTVPILDVTDEIRTNTIKIYPGASVGTEVMYIGINASEVRFEQDIVTNASSVIRAIDTDDTDAAGSLTIRGGTNPGTAPGGNVTINGGTGSTDGNVYIGSTGTGAVSIGNISGGSIDIYGGVEFNDGTTAFQNGQTLSVNTNNFYAREIHGPVDGTLYLGGRTSSAKVNNIAMDSTRTLLQQDVRLSNNSTLSFASGTTVNFANTTVQNLQPKTPYTKFWLDVTSETVPPLSEQASTSFLGQNWGTWTEVTFANNASLPANMAPGSATYDPTLSGITFFNNRFQGFVQGGVYEFMIEIETRDGAGRPAEVEQYSFETSTGDFGNFSRYYPGNNLYQTLQFSAIFHFEDADTDINWIRINLNGNMQPSYYVDQAIFTIKRIA